MPTPPTEQFDVVGIGNAIVDVLVQAEDDVLEAALERPAVRGVSERRGERDGDLALKGEPSNGSSDGDRSRREADDSLSLCRLCR